MKLRALDESRHTPKASRDLRGTRSQKQARDDGDAATLHDPTVCEGCGAIYSRKTWRRPEARGARVSAGPDPVLGRCPACDHARTGHALGQAILRGTYVRANEEEIRRRVRHVALRAGHANPERRIISMRRTPDGLDVRTSTQDLAHRIVVELKKAFRGRASYAWSDRDGSLRARWERALEAGTP